MTRRSRMFSEGLWARAPEDGRTSVTIEVDLSARLVDRCWLCVCFFVCPEPMPEAHVLYASHCQAHTRPHREMPVRRR